MQPLLINILFQINEMINSETVENETAFINGNEYSNKMLGISNFSAYQRVKNGNITFESGDIINDNMIIAIIADDQPSMKDPVVISICYSRLPSLRILEVVSLREKINEYLKNESKLAREELDLYYVGLGVSIYR